MLTNPARVAVTPAATTVERIAQRAIHVDKAAKPRTLIQLLADPTIDRALVFTRTKHGADRVVRGLVDAGISAQALHGNKSQSQREKTLAAFRSGAVRTLVATDIAARGIDVTGISHVINYDLPNVPESYVHRIGRTARAGREGVAISLVSSDEAGLLRDIEKLIRIAIPASGEAPRTGAVSGPHRRRNGSKGANAHRGNGQRGGGQAAGENRKADAGSPGKKAHRRRFWARGKSRPQGQAQTAHVAAKHS
jgi:superfamily II DNA/RNA helicase